MTEEAVAQHGQRVYWAFAYWSVDVVRRDVDVGGDEEPLLLTQWARRRSSLCRSSASDLGQLGQSIGPQGPRGRV